MDSIIHADIFFFIASLGLIIAIIIGVVMGLYILFIARDISYIVKKFKHESDNISADIAMARQKIRDQGARVASFLAMIKNFMTFKNIIKTSNRNKNNKSNKSDEQSNEQ